VGSIFVTGESSTELSATWMGGQWWGFGGVWWGEMTFRVKDLFCRAYIIVLGQRYPLMIACLNERKPRKES
jgi:hypothetical protein